MAPMIRVNVKGKFASSNCTNRNADSATKI